MTSPMSSHVTVSNGSAHHTRRDANRAGGGGGGRGTIDGTVLLLSLTVSMTVTEVTTRIAVVGAVSLLGLVLVARAPSSVISQVTKRSQNDSYKSGSSVLVGARTSHAAATDIDDSSAGRRAQSQGMRFVGLAVTTVVAGVSLGITLSLAFLVGLNSLNLG
ncbi:MAG: hypothetical protein RL072_555 [Actinomycetota bacterium]|jgi:hypothetical protein